MTEEKIDEAIKEEFADISLCALTLDLRGNYEIMNKKLNRCIKRNTKNLEEKSDEDQKELYNLLKINDFLEINDKTAIRLDLTSIIDLLYSLV